VVWIGYSYLHSLTGSAYDWAYNTIPQVEALDIRKYWPRGKGLGGSGAINGETLLAIPIAVLMTD
jgi:choline dehydrogenase